MVRVVDRNGHQKLYIGPPKSNTYRINHPCKGSSPRYHISFYKYGIKTIRWQHSCASKIAWIIWSSARRFTGTTLYIGPRDGSIREFSIWFDSIRFDSTESNRKSNYLLNRLKNRIENRIIFSIYDKIESKIERFKTPNRKSKVLKSRIENRIENRIFGKAE